MRAGVSYIANNPSENYLIPFSLRTALHTQIVVLIFQSNFVTENILVGFWMEADCFFPPKSDMVAFEFRFYVRVNVYCFISSTR